MALKHMYSTRIPCSSREHGIRENNASTSPRKVRDVRTRKNSEAPLEEKMRRFLQERPSGESQFRLGAPNRFAFQKSHSISNRLRNLGSFAYFCSNARGFWEERDFEGRSRERHWNSSKALRTDDSQPRSAVPLVLFGAQNSKHETPCSHPGTCSNYQCAVLISLALNSAIRHCGNFDLHPVVREDENAIKCTPRPLAFLPIALLVYSRPVAKATSASCR